MSLKTRLFTLIIICMVGLPPAYLFLTEPGKRHKELVIAWLNKKETTSFDLSGLSQNLTPPQVTKNHSHLEWHCIKETSAYGDYLCDAPIAAYNGYPAYYMSWYFSDHKLIAVKILYRGDYHQAVINHLQTKFGPASPVAQLIEQTPNATPILEWQLNKGKVFINQSLQPQDESALIWLTNS